MGRRTGPVSMDSNVLNHVGADVSFVFLLGGGWNQLEEHRNLGEPFSWIGQ